MNHREIASTGARQRSWPPSFRGLVAVCAGMLILSAGNVLARMRETADPVVKVGEDAPDFELPRLTIASDPNGKPVGVISATDMVRLSAFRGKKPVCLIMSSYT